MFFKYRQQYSKIKPDETTPYKDEPNENKPYIYRIKISRLKWS
jgi:hypothetical protein